MRARPSLPCPSSPSSTFGPVLPSMPSSPRPLLPFPLQQQAPPCDRAVAPPAEFAPAVRLPSLPSPPLPASTKHAKVAASLASVWWCCQCSGCKGAAGASSGRPIAPIAPPRDTRSCHLGIVASRGQAQCYLSPCDTPVKHPKRVPPVVMSMSRGPQANLSAGLTAKGLPLVATPASWTPNFRLYFARVVSCAWPVLMGGSALAPPSLSRPPVRATRRNQHAMRQATLV